MTYQQTINDLFTKLINRQWKSTALKVVPQTLTGNRKFHQAGSTAFSSFIQNDEMGKGAEKAVEKKLNSEKDYVCKSYGEHSSLIAEDVEFKEFYKNQVCFLLK